jgi:hypothetical protein
VRKDGQRYIGLAVGGLGPIVVGVALVPFRRDLDNAHLALILVLVVVLAAIVGGRAAGAIAAVTATLSFDFFLTRPYNSIRIESADDIETVLILLAVGLLVGAVAARGRRSRDDRKRAAAAIERVHRVAAKVAGGADLDEIVAVVIAEVRALLQLQDCWLELPSAFWPVPRLERGGTIEAGEHQWLARGFTLPQDGLQLPVLVAGDEIGRLILIGDPVVDVTLEERIIAVALADQLGSALSIAGPAARDRLAEELSHRE